MATKKLPDFRITALPFGAILRTEGDNLAFRDEIRSLVRRDRGDNAGSGTSAPVPGAPPSSEISSVSSWKDQTQFLSISPTLDYIEFAEKVEEGANAVAGKTPRSGGVGGFVLKARAKPVNCRVVGDEAAPPGESGLMELPFRQLKPFPKPDSPLAWETVRPFDSRSTCLQLVELAPDTAAEVASEILLAGNQQLRFEILWIGVVAGQRAFPGARFSWGGGQYSVCFRRDGDGQVLPTFETQTSSGWRVLRAFPSAKFADFAGLTTVGIRRIAGRTVITLSTNDSRASFEYLHTQQRVVADGEKPEIQLRNAQWNRGKINISAFGVKFRVGIKLLDHSGNDDKPLSGEFERKIPRSMRVAPFFHDRLALGKARESDKAALFTAGWRSTAARVGYTVGVDHTGLSYKVRLSASSDKHSSPFVSAVLGKFDADTLGDDAAGLDVTSAFLHGNYSSASPEIQSSGATVSLSFSRNLLETIGSENGVNWEEWIQQYRMLRIETRWRLSDGSYSAWQSVGEFYIEDDDFEVSGVHTWKLSLSCADQTLRLREPHSRVDHRYLFDLVYLLMQKNGGRGGQLFGGECVKYLLGVELGKDHAALLNGNGDPLRYQPPDMYPLFDSETGVSGYVLQMGQTGPPTHNGPVMPPPSWGCGVSEWISQLCEKDAFSLFFYAPNPDTGIGLVPIYGRYEEWVANSPTWTVSDANYDTGDLDFLISHLSARRRGDSNFNGVSVWTNPPHFNANQLPFPAVFMFDERLPPSDPKSEENTGWSRRFLQRDIPWWSPQSGQLWASLFLKGLSGLDIRYPSVTLRRGDARIFWGHKLRFKCRNNGQQGGFSDPNLRLEEITFRILSVKHSFSKEKTGLDSFTTTLSLFPMLRNEQ